MASIIGKAIHAEFAKANKAGDLAAGVKLARAAIVKNLWTGSFEDDPASLAALLIGDRSKSGAANSWQQQCEQLFAALVVGIAIGQLMHPDVFATKGGQR